MGKLTLLDELKKEILDLRYEAHIAGNIEYKNALNQVIIKIDDKILKSKKLKLQKNEN